jgi:membrane associated rhomboid family serine protease
VIPIGDDNGDRRTKPYVTYAFSAVPSEILSGRDLVTADRMVVDPSTGERAAVPGLGRTPLSVCITLLVSMFMHGGIAHILGNMLSLFIFGDNVEDGLGHVRFLLFYLFCGAAASLAHVFAT